MGAHRVQAARGADDASVRSARREKRSWILAGTGAEAPERARWKAICNTEKEYARTHWERVTAQRAPVSAERRADGAAEYLVRMQLGGSEAQEGQAERPDTVGDTLGGEGSLHTKRVR